jgi:hypothetical protein
MKKYLGLLILASGALLWQSCRKEPLNHLSNDESRIYITQHDSTADFTTYKTFGVSDSVALLVNGKFDGMRRDSADSLFIAGFTAAMEQAGYTAAPVSDSPNLIINLTHLSNNYVGVTYFSDYGDYWDPYDFGYGGYGYGFPDYYTAYQVSEDALAFDMFDVQHAARNKQLKDVWSALIKGEGIFTPANVSSEVGILFSQSPYLKQ